MADAPAAGEDFHPHGPPLLGHGFRIDRQNVLPLRGPHRLPVGVAELTGDHQPGLARLADVGDEAQRLAEPQVGNEELHRAGLDQLVSVQQHRRQLLGLQRGRHRNGRPRGRLAVHDRGLARP